MMMPTECHRTESFAASANTFHQAQSREQPAFSNEPRNLLSAQWRAYRIPEPLRRVSVFVSSLSRNGPIQQCLIQAFAHAVSLSKA